MSVDDTAGATGGQPGYPNLRTGSEGWQSGQSGNPSGVSKYQAMIRRAIEKQESAQRVCEVVDAMRVDALAHEKFSPAAAKVYLQAVGVQLNREQVKVDLSDAPPEVMKYLETKIH